MAKNTCETCGKTFSKDWRLVEHIRSHTGERPFKCLHEGCHKTFVRQYHLKRHNLTHTGEKSFSCKFEGCGKTFTLQHSLKRHQERAHNQPFKCDVAGCGMSFSKNNKLTSHKEIHATGKPYGCTVPGCTSSFIYPNKLARHLKVHEKEYKCSVDECQMIFSSWSKLTRHSRTHRKQPKCQECGQVCCDERELRRHITIHSSTRKVYVCPEDGCSRSYTKKYNLKVHIRSFHCEELHLCQHKGCGKSFAHKVSLNNHMETHKKKAKKEKKRRKRKSLAAKLTRYKGKEKDGPDRVSCNLSLKRESITTTSTSVILPCEGKTDVSTPTPVAEETLTSRAVTDSKLNTLLDQPQVLLENQYHATIENHLQTHNVYLSKEHTPQLVQCSVSS